MSAIKLALRVRLMDQLTIIATIALTLHLEYKQLDTKVGRMISVNK